MPVGLKVNNVYKSFGKIKALRGVSLEAEQGKVYGLLGPNGAGKTTIVRMLSTLLLPDKGGAEVLGIDVATRPKEVREKIGLAGQFAAVDEFLTGRENIYIVARLYHLSRSEAKKRTDDLLERFDLMDAANRPVRTYSGGMRRRLDLGASLVGQPSVLFLDEPTTGLDPRTRLDLWDIIRDLVANGTTILLTTQYLEEADELASKIAVLDYGKIIAEGTSDELKKQIGGDVVELELKDLSDVDKAKAAIKSATGKQAKSGSDARQLSVPVKNGAESLTAVVREMDQQGVVPESLSLHRPSLDDVFLTLTGTKSKSKSANNKRRPGGKNDASA